MKVVQYTLLGAGLVATLALPIYLLHLATNALADNKSLADQYSAWSSALVALGPSLYTTSLLAMFSRLPLFARIGFSLIAPALAVYSYVQLWQIGKDFYIPMVLGIAGVIYCVLADLFTPVSPPKAKASTAGLVPTLVTLAVAFVFAVVLGARDNHSSRNR